MILSNINMLYKTIYIWLLLLFFIHSQYLIWPNTSISSEVKKFILDNIDLLPQEIYKRLVKHGLNINICQKQIYFWWIELSKSKYKRDKDSFLFAQK